MRLSVAFIVVALHCARADISRLVPDAVSQSSTYLSYNVGRAFDTTITTFSHTQLDSPASITAQYYSDFLVTTVDVTNRCDCCGSMLGAFKVHVGFDSVGSNNPVCPGSYSSTTACELVKVTCNLAGQYVTLITDTTTNLVLADLRIYGVPVSFLYDRLTPVNSSQSSTWTSPGFFPSSNAYDNQWGTFAHTLSNAPAWNTADLGSSKSITFVEVVNRYDCCGSSLGSFSVRVGNDPLATNNPACTGSYSSNTEGEFVEVPCGLTGRYVSVVTEPSSRSTNLELTEVRIYGR